jgi:hypothetical protein
VRYRVVRELRFIGPSGMTGPDETIPVGAIVDQLLPGDMTPEETANYKHRVKALAKHGNGAPLIPFRWEGRMRFAHLGKGEALAAVEVGGALLRRAVRRP